MLLLLLLYDKVNKNESEGNVKVMGAQEIHRSARNKSLTNVRLSELSL
jgi:hypothetical protein